MKDQDVFSQYEEKSLPEKDKTCSKPIGKGGSRYICRKPLWKNEKSFCSIHIAVFVLPDPENAILHRMVIPH